MAVPDRAQHRHQPAAPAAAADRRGAGGAGPARRRGERAPGLAGLARRPDAGGDDRGPAPGAAAGHRAALHDGPAQPGDRGDPRTLARGRAAAAPAGDEVPAGTAARAQRRQPRRSGRQTRIGQGNACGRLGEPRAAPHPARALDPPALPSARHERPPTRAETLTEDDRCRRRQRAPEPRPVRSHRTGASRVLINESQEQGYPMSVATPDTQWFSSDHDPLVGRLRTLDWAEVPEGARERCWERIASHGSSVNGTETPAVESKSRTAGSVGERYEVSRCATPGRPAVAQGWARRPTYRTGLSLA